MKRRKNAENNETSAAAANAAPADTVAETEVAATDLTVTEKNNGSTQNNDICKPASCNETAENPEANEGVVVNGKILTKKQKARRTALQWLSISFGAFLMACSVYFFQVPNNFTLGGVGGISIILSDYITPHVPFLSQAVIMAIINVLLLVVGFIFLGKGCTLRTVYCSLLYTALIWLFELTDLIGLITGVPTPKGGIPTPLTDGQTFLELCFAILLFGVGGALIFNSGASSGGTDIIALILKKFSRLNVGVALMIVDFIVIVVSIFTFKSITTALYSFLGLFARTFLLDGVIESMGKTKYLTIITQNPHDIGEYILKVVNHSYTMYDAEGGYTHEKKKVLVTVCKRNEALKIKLKVRQVDPQAFVIITDANEILGKGFGGAV